MYERMSRLLRALSTDLLEREEAIRLGLLVAVAGESLFLLGAPGTGKSLVARRLQQAFANAASFSYLMGRFSTPDEVFGPLSIRALRDRDSYERATAGYLPEADVVFLDEIWKASPPIQNALLTALNERRFRNGTLESVIPLKVFIGASNELPAESDEAAAFWDRFLVRLVVDPIRDDDAFAALLGETEDPYRTVVETDLQITDEEYADLRASASSVTIPADVLALIAAIRAALATPPEGQTSIYVSDRRWKKIAGLLRTSAFLHGRDRVETIDCAIIRYCAWSTVEEIPRVSAVVAEELARGSGHRREIDAAAARLRELQASVGRKTSHSVETREIRPRLYRDEYVRLVDPKHTHDGERLLVWEGDVRALQRDGAGVIDIFLYDAQEQLIGSQQAHAAWREEWTIEIDGESHAIETQERQTTVEARRALEASERDEMTQELGELGRRLDDHLDRLAREQLSLEDAAQTHLFVALADAQSVLSSIRESAARVGELRLLVTETANELAAGA